MLESYLRPQYKAEARSINIAAHQLDPTARLLRELVTQGQTDPTAAQLRAGTGLEQSGANRLGQARA
jgi:hypothetical protein